MEVLRKIGKFDLLVETSEPCGIYLEESAIPSAEGKNAVHLEKSRMLSILASGDDYLPLTLRWEILDRCNFSCPFCYIVGHSFAKLVRFSEIKKHLSILINEGLLFCTLTGGEVTIHPDFRSIYKLLKEHGVIVEVYTNGYAFDDDLIDLFRAHPPMSVEVSIYTLINERLREVYGVRDNNGASRVLENVLRLKRAGINVLCKTFVNTITSRETDSIFAWCRRNQIEHYSSTEITRAYDGTDLGSYAVQGRTAQPKEMKQAVCLPCKTRNFGSSINASFSICPCPAIMLNDCTFDIRQFGVIESLRRMKAFIRRFQDTEIRGSKVGTGSYASCMAYARPIRDQAGELLYFVQP